MGFVFLIFVGIIIAFIAGACKGGSHSASVYNGYDDDYMRPDEDERSCFSEDLADDYNSYYMQTYDDALMGDSDAIDEMREELGEEWGGEF